MRLSSKKGFIIILVTVSLAVLVLSASVIVSIGCSELMATRVRNDLLVSAYYVAISGAELMYSDLKTKSTVTWDPTASGNITVGSTTIGSYSATATRTITGEEFCIVSTGTVNNHTATATVKYGYRASDINLEGPIPFGSRGDIILTGASNPSQLIMDGPVLSNSTVTTNPHVTVANGTVDGASLPEITFWVGTEFDTNNDGNYVTDTNSDGTVTRAEAIAQEKESVFNADNAYNPSDNEIIGKDAFYYYYTTYLDAAANNKLGQDLAISSGETYHYTVDQFFDQGDIANSVPIIFVDGNVTITNNDQNWQGSDTLSHTIVATGTISITQPTNRPGDSLTLVAYGDVSTTGEMGDKGGTIGDLVIYTNGNFTAENGGKMNASIYANGTCTINTVGDDEGKDHRVVRLLTVEWEDADDMPLGLPQGYPCDISLSTNFTVKNQSEKPPVWQRK